MVKYNGLDFFIVQRQFVSKILQATKLNKKEKLPNSQVSNWDLQVSYMPCIALRSQLTFAPAAITSQVFLIHFHKIVS